jgi:hypothetical protein
MRPYPELVKTVAHVAFEVDDLEAAIAGHKILIAPNSPSRGVLVAFIEVNGAPVELMQVDRDFAAGRLERARYPGTATPYPDFFNSTREDQS